MRRKVVSNIKAHNGDEYRVLGIRVTPRSLETLKKRANGYNMSVQQLVIGALEYTNLMSEDFSEFLDSNTVKAGRGRK